MNRIYKKSFVLIIFLVLCFGRVFTLSFEVMDKIQDELFESAESGDLETLKKLIEKGDGFYPNATDCDGNTLLHIAAGYGHKEMAEFLVKIGAALDVRNSLDETPLQTFFGDDNKDRIEIINFLISGGADVFVNNGDGDTVLHVLAKSFYSEHIREAINNFIKKGVAVNDQNCLGKTALHYAFGYCNEEAAAALIENGADIKIKDNQGAMPVETMWLIYPDEEPDTKLICKSIFLRWKKVFGMLLDRGMGNVKLIDKHGNTTLHYAAEANFKEIIGFLINSGVDVNSKNKDGNTPLLSAVRAGNSGFVEELLKYGSSSVDVKDVFLETPLGVVNSKIKKVASEVTSPDSGYCGKRFLKELRHDLEKIRKLLIDYGAKE